MIKATYASRIRMSVTLLLMISLFSLAAPAASAFDGAGDKNKQAGDEARPSETAGAASAGEMLSRSDLPEPKPMTFSYVLYNGATPAKPAPEIAPAAAKIRLPKIFPALPMPAVSTAPMTVGEKFNYWVKSSFYPPGPYINAVVSGMWSEAWDNNVGKKDTFDDYLADSMTRAARRFGNRAANGFFEKFLYPSILKQDPRYHRSGKKGAGAKVGWALSRLFVTQGDRGGDQPNISFLAGGLSGAFVSREWQREDKQSTKDTFKRWGNHIVITGLTNILREFLGGQ